MNKRAFAAGLLGGIAMYVWSSVAHVALPLGSIGIREIPNEQPLLDHLRTTVGEDAGMYMFPALGTAPDAMQQYAQKLAANPSGLLIYHPPGGQPMTPRQLTVEFLTELAEAMLAVFLLAQTALKSFGSRVGFVITAGILAALATNVSYWNWYGFPATYTLSYMSIQVVGFAAAGVAAALVMKNRALQ
jgi:hypothetical protein